MQIAIIKLIFLLTISRICAGKPKKREIATSITNADFNRYTKNGRSIPVNVFLHNLSTLSIEAEVPLLQRGLLKVLSPSGNSLFMCFPQNADDYEQLYLFSHVSCRQMGYMTFTNISKSKEEIKVSPRHTGYYGLMPNSCNCTGQEQNISHCKWNNIRIGYCQMVTQLSCGVCHKVVKQTHGVIHSPGFRIANIFDLTCEWDILTPEGHTILLSFDIFDALDAKLPLPCEMHMPHVEIMYGIQSRVTVQRYCQLKELKNISIPFNTVKIRFFTGFYSNHMAHLKDKGIYVTFEAIRMKEEVGSPLKMILLALLGLIFVACLWVCHFIQKNKLCDYIPQDQNEGAKNDMKKAYEFQRFDSQRAGNLNCGFNILSNEKKVKSKRFYSNTSEPIDESIKDARVLLSEDETSGTYISGNGHHLVDFMSDQEKQGDAVKVNLLYRYPKEEDPNRLSVSSPVFYPSKACFRINRTVSSDSGIEKKKKAVSQTTSF